MKYFRYSLVKLKVITECVVHYKNQSNYSQLKRLTEINVKRIREAQLKRLKVGGSHTHQEQTENIPEEIDFSNHGIHPSDSMLKQNSLTLKTLTFFQD